MRCTATAVFVLVALLFVTGILGGCAASDRARAERLDAEASRTRAEAQATAIITDARTAARATDKAADAAAQATAVAVETQSKDADAERRQQSFQAFVERALALLPHVLAILGTVVVLVAFVLAWRWMASRQEERRQAAAGPTYVTNNVYLLTTDETTPREMYKTLSSVVHRQLPRNGGNEVHLLGDSRDQGQRGSR